MDVATLIYSSLDEIGSAIADDSAMFHALLNKYMDCSAGGSYELLHRVALVFHTQSISHEIEYPALAKEYANLSAVIESLANFSAA